MKQFDLFSKKEEIKIEKSTKDVDQAEILSERL
jgi:hypothetical protein